MVKLRQGVKQINGETKNRSRQKSFCGLLLALGTTSGLGSLRSRRTTVRLKFTLLHGVLGSRWRRRFALARNTALSEEKSGFFRMLIHETIVVACQQTHQMSESHKSGTILVRLTSRNLEDTSLAGAKLHTGNIDLNSAMADIKDHVHLFRVLGPLHAVGRELHDARPDERRAEQFRKAECGVFDLSGFDARRSVCNVYMASSLAKELA